MIQTHQSVRQTLARVRPRRPGARAGPCGRARRGTRRPRTPCPRSRGPGPASPVPGVAGSESPYGPGPRTGPQSLPRTPRAREGRVPEKAQAQDPRLMPPSPCLWPGHGSLPAIVSKKSKITGHFWPEQSQELFPPVAATRLPATRWRVPGCRARPSGCSVSQAGGFRVRTGWPGLVSFLSKDIRSCFRVSVPGVQQACVCVP